MRYFYRAPDAALRPYLGSFYLMDMPQAMSGQVRVEIPHIRFLCRGTSTLSVGERSDAFGSPEVLVCGPSFQTGGAEVTDNTLIIGVSLTPAGWQKLTGVSAEDYANRKVGLSAIRDDVDLSGILATLQSGGDDDALFDAIEAFVAAALLPDQKPRWDFIEPAMAWASDADCPGVEDLSARTGLSARQVDRLCRYYFGGSPKQVHRVFRALNISYRLTVEGAESWRDVVGPFYDQSHFIKDFKDRIGCTPSEFSGPFLDMMRFDLQRKSKIAETPRYCLIG